MLHNNFVRVTVRAGSHAADLTLSPHVEVADLVPDLVDLLVVDPGPPVGDWRLSRLLGGQLDRSSSLRDNRVVDGEILTLAPAVDGAEPPRLDVFDAVAGDGTPAWNPRATRLARVVVGLIAAGIGALAVTRGGVTPVVSAVIALVALVAAAIRSRDDSMVASAFGVCAALFGGAAGFAAVPGPPGWPTVTLAAASAASVAVLALRLTHGGTAVFAGVAAAAGLTATAASVAELLDAGVAAVGATLATCALALLTQSARLSLLVCRITPYTPADDAVRADRAAATFTGLVGGFAAITAGAAVAAAANASWNGTAFAAAVAMVLLLRARTHVAREQVAALLIAGMAIVTTVLGAAALRWPLIGVGAVAVGGFVMWRGLPSADSPVQRRIVEVSEYLALAALPPLTCWICGVFAAARGLA